MTFRKLRNGLIVATVALGLGVLLACDDRWDMLFQDSDEVTEVSALATELGFSQDRPLIMGMNTSYAPLQYVDGNGVPSGYDVKFTKMLMQRMGIPFTFSPNIWDKMSPGVIGGKYDLGMMVYSSYRKDVTNYSTAVFRLYYQIVYRKKDYTEFDFRHLKDKKIAYMKSRPIGTMLKKEEAQDVSVTDLGEAFLQLAEGEYDGLICYRFQAAYFIEQYRLKNQLQADELTLEPREYCYASYNVQLIDSINAELKRMEAEGLIDEVYGENVVSQFGAIKIPIWVWLLGLLLTFVFLILYSVNRHRLSKRLQIAHQELLKAYDQMSEKNEALVIANARAEESTRMKSAFIKQISHEIRTPLNILSGFTQILASPDTKLSDDEKASVSRQIIENTGRITGLVNKMLELADVSSQAVLTRNDEVSARCIADEAVMASGIADTSHLTFNVKAGEGADVPVKTHQRSAVRILELLLDNAMKFTRPAEAYMASKEEGGQARITLSVSQHDGHVCFVVEDNGIGVPAHEAERIFDEFVQLDEYYDGTGIGLAVARSLARRLGGDVVLDTTYTDGARFVMTL